MFLREGKIQKLHGNEKWEGPEETIKHDTEWQFPMSPKRERELCAYSLRKNTMILELQSHQF